jgi:hypothetical protein
MLQNLPSVLSMPFSCDDTVAHSLTLPSLAVLGETTNPWLSANRLDAATAKVANKHHHHRSAVVSLFHLYYLYFIITAFTKYYQSLVPLRQLGGAHQVIVLLQLICKVRKH